VVENVFGTLKKTFKKLLLKINLHIFFISNVVTCYCLYTFILDGKDVDVDALML
jgi:hypothetical protein